MTVAIALGGLGIVGLAAYAMFNFVDIVQPPKPPQKRVVTVTKTPTVAIAKNEPEPEPEPEPEVQHPHEVHLAPPEETKAAVEPTVQKPNLDLKAKQAFDRAMLAKDKGDTKTAIKELTEALKLAPKFVTAYNSRGLLL